MELGRGESRVGQTVGLLGALALHGAAFAKGASAMVALGAFVGAVQGHVEGSLRAQIDIELAKVAPKPPEPPPPEPPPEPQQPTVQPKTELPKAPPDSKIASNDSPPPAAAEAGRILAAEPTPDEVLDLSGNTFITGTGERFAGGVTATKGTSKIAVRDTRATGSGVPGGTGTGGPAKTMEPAQDLSRAARPASLNWDCSFPPEADAAQIDFMRVMVIVTVSAQGTATKVQVLNDPGYGFGRMAQQCALKNRYQVGLDRSGNAVSSTTPPFAVKFQRL